ATGPREGTARLRFSVRDTDAPEHPELLDRPREHARQVPRRGRNVTANAEARYLQLAEVGVAAFHCDVLRELVADEAPERGVILVAVQATAAIGLELGLAHRATHVESAHAHLRGCRKCKGRTGKAQYCDKCFCFH